MSADQFAFWMLFGLGFAVLVVLAVVLYVKNLIAEALAGKKQERRIIIGSPVDSRYKLQSNKRSTNRASRHLD